MGKKNKKSKAERRKASQAFAQSRQATREVGETTTEAKSLSGMVNEAVTHMKSEGKSDSDAYNAVVKATTLTLRDAHKIASNPNYNIRQVQKNTAIKGIESLLEELTN